VAFSKPLRIANLVPSGHWIELNGHLQVTEYPHIAVDRSHGPSRGTIYVVYPDGRNKIIADANSASGSMRIGYFLWSSLQIRGDRFWCLALSAARKEISAELDATNSCRSSGR